ncbi:hypothetical protein Dimus_009080 [Dionaea muscipula]
MLDLVPCLASSHDGLRAMLGLELCSALCVKLSSTTVYAQCGVELSVLLYSAGLSSAMKDTNREEEEGLSVFGVSPCSSMG